MRPGNKSELDTLNARLFLRAGDTVFDIGGNVGRTAALYLEHGAGLIHVFEPEPVLADRLSKEFRENERVTVHAFGLGKNEGLYRLLVSEENPGSHTLSSSFAEALDAAHNHTKQREEVLVQIRKLDDIDVGPADFLKIDTEGAELDVLEGASETLRTRPPRFLQVESFPVPNLGRFRSTIDFLLGRFRYVWAPTVDGDGLYRANEARESFKAPEFMELWLSDGNPLLCASNFDPKAIAANVSELAV